MSDIKTQHLPEIAIPGKRLGRHVEHDPRSRDHAIDTTGLTLRSIVHRRYGGIFDQGEIGSCTGNATAGAINTAPLHKSGKALVEADAVKLYERATVIDGIEGAYPPDDTGSSGLAAAKAAKEAGYISSYKHAFNMEQALAALMLGPVITGVAWYEGFDNPDSSGNVQIAGQVRGGHEFEIAAYQLSHTNSPLDAVVGAINSWSATWGVGGKFYFTVRTWQQLLDDQGDVTALLK